MSYAWTYNKAMPTINYSSHPHTLHITVDPRIELLAVVQYLAGYGQRFPLLTAFDIEYKKEVETAFQTFRAHPAVKLFDQMSVDGFNCDAPPWVMLHLSPPPELEVQTPFIPYLIRRASNKLEKLIPALRNFAMVSDFMAFYRTHSTFYETITRPIIAQYSGHHDISVFENYYGMGHNSYTMIFAPLFSDGGYGPQVRREDGLFDVFSITGPTGIDVNNQPIFSMPTGVRSLIWHEFAHPLINPLTERYIHKVNEYQALFQMVKERMTSYGYVSWEAVVNETIVRAVVVRMKALELGEAEGQSSLAQELEWGFAYTDLLVKQLKQYEQQRDRYPTFRDFYSKLIEAFAEV